ncbi:MAG: hypothetical protein KDC44_06390 [Phaeodactylibacter sp.]|nr:hypothetical protein [Phaeodactylibacter sp.]
MSKSKRRPAAEWKDLVEAQASSHESIVEFCRTRGLNRPTFQYWRGKLKSVAAEPEGFVTLRPAGSGRILIRYGGDVEIELPGDYPLEALVHLLKQG